MMMTVYRARQDEEEFVRLQRRISRQLKRHRPFTEKEIDRIVFEDPTEILPSRCLRADILCWRKRHLGTTLPKAIVRQLPEVEYFEITLRHGEVILRPVVVTAPAERLNAVRAKIKALKLTQKDVEDAIRWARRRG